MKKFLISLMVLVLSLSSIQVLAADAPEAPEGWLLEYFTDFGEDHSPGDFYTYFTGWNVKDDNYVEGDDGDVYYHGKWSEGASLKTLDTYDNYVLDFLFSAGFENNNCYKAGVGLNISSVNAQEFEPDNGDDDKISYCGTSGVFLYMYGNKVEVVVKTNKDGGTAGPIDGSGNTGVIADASSRNFGVYGVACFFYLPEGKTFDNYVNMNITNKDGLITVKADGTVLGTIEMTDIKSVETKSIEDSCYTNVVVKNASGEALMTVEQAVVASEGIFAFANRACPFKLDNVAIYLEAPEPTPEPTPAPTPDPNATPVPTEAPATDVPATEAPAADDGEDDSADKDEGSNTLVIILVVAIVVAIVVVAGMILVMIIINKKKQK